ncbi:MAG TPA: DUF3857 domain-containing protein [bacterium]|nr:DUF3857 domain-containing protein [bacterium]
MLNRIYVFLISTALFLLLSSCATGGIGANGFANLPVQIDLKNLPTADQYPESDGIILYENTVYDVDYVPGVGMETYKTVHEVYRIFRNEEAFMENMMGFDEKTTIESFYARTIKPDGKTIELKEEDIYRMNMELTNNGHSRKNYGLAHNFSSLKKGDIVELKYTVISRYFYFSDIYFIQDRLPKKYSRFEIKIPNFVFDAEFEFKYKVKNIALPDPVYTKGMGDSGDRSYVWENKDIPAFKPEPFSGPDYLYQGSVELELAYWNTWNGYARDHYDRNYKPVIDEMSSKDKKRIKEKVDELTTGISNELEKIKALTKFVQTFRYNNLAMFGHPLKPNEIGLILDREYGDCKDHAALLTAMLREIGVKAWPTLIRAEDPTGIDPKFVTDIFNHVIVKVTLDGGQVLWLDPTSKFAAFGRLPEMDEDTYAIELRPKNKEEDLKLKLERTPKSNYSDSLIEKNVKGRIENDTAKFEVVTRFFGNMANYNRYVLENMNDEELEKMIRQTLLYYIYDAKISNISMKNLYNPELPLILSCSVEFKIPENNRIPVVPVLFLKDPLDVNAAYLTERTKPVIFPIVYSTKETYEMNFDAEKYALPDYFEDINKEISEGNSNKWTVISENKPGKISFTVEYGQKEKIVKTESVYSLLKKITGFSLLQSAMYRTWLVPKTEKVTVEKTEEKTEEKVETK